MNKNNKGFTLVELLVVISIIGILSTLAITSFNSVRVKARDAKRLAELRQMQLGLELYSLDNNDLYPVPNGGNVITLDNNIYSTLCYKENDTNGFYGNKNGCNTIFMINLPQDPQELVDYTYRSLDGGARYEVSFQLERDMKNPKLNCTINDCYLTPEGFKNSI